MRLLLIVLAMLSQVPAAGFPEAEIASSGIRVKMYLPDAKAGYYQGTRFDWSGAISSLTWNGHEYFGPWFERHDPKIHDAIPGPVEEFLTGKDSSLGYDEAKPGEPFVRIGVGAVRKPQNAAEYKRFETYELVDPGKWTINKSANAIEFIHELADTNGYAYEYRKVVRLTADTLVLEHRLRNTGKKAISTSVYNHNFFTLDRQQTGPHIAVQFGFDPRAARAMNDLAEVKGREIRFLRDFSKGQTVFTEVEGFGATAADHDFRMENRRTGAGVRITGDRPLLKVYFWSALQTVCPEPYIDVSVEPGKTSEWRTTYQFYKASQQK
jgi:hypothetical protein